ncbi:hypothetical protein ADUPG1_013735, partial [Aduncisulcus paluster]
LNCLKSLVTGSSLPTYGCPICSLRFKVPIDGIAQFPCVVAIRKVYNALQEQIRQSELKAFSSPAFPSLTHSHSGSLLPQSHESHSPTPVSALPASIFPIDPEDPPYCDNCAHEYSKALSLAPVGGDSSTALTPTTPSKDAPRKLSHFQRAVVKCMDCDAFLCAQCNTQLHSHHLLSHHTCIPLVTIPKCPFHGFPLLLFCMECNCLCCRVCAELHKGHKVEVGCCRSREESELKSVKAGKGKEDKSHPSKQTHDESAGKIEKFTYKKAEKKGMEYFSTSLTQQPDRRDSMATKASSLSSSTVSSSSQMGPLGGSDLKTRTKTQKGKKSGSVPALSSSALSSSHPHTLVPITRALSQLSSALPRSLSHSSQITGALQCLLTHHAALLHQLNKQDIASHIQRIVAENIDILLTKIGLPARDVRFDLDQCMKDLDDAVFGADKKRSVLSGSSHSSHLAISSSISPSSLEHLSSDTSGIGIVSSDDDAQSLINAYSIHKKLEYNLLKMKNVIDEATSPLPLLVLTQIEQSGVDTYKQQQHSLSSASSSTGTSKADVVQGSSGIESDADEQVNAVVYHTFPQPASLDELKSTISSSLALSTSLKNTTASHASASSSQSKSSSSDGSSSSSTHSSALTATIRHSSPFTLSTASFSHASNPLRSPRRSVSSSKTPQNLTASSSEHLSSSSASSTEATMASLHAKRLLHVTSSSLPPLASSASSALDGAVYDGALLTVKNVRKGGVVCIRMKEGWMSGHIEAVKRTKGKNFIIVLAYLKHRPGSVSITVRGSVSTPETVYMHPLWIENE